MRVQLLTFTPDTTSMHSKILLSSPSYYSLLRPPKTRFSSALCNTHRPSVAEPTGQDVERTVPAPLRPPCQCDRQPGIMVRQTASQLVGMHTCLHYSLVDLVFATHYTTHRSDSAQSTGRDTPVPTPMPLLPSCRCNSLASGHNNK